MNCQWQSFLCRVDGNLLNMFGEAEAERPPRCSIPLRGCEVGDGPDTESSFRIRLSSGEQAALLEVSSRRDVHACSALLSARVRARRRSALQKKSGDGWRCCGAELWMAVTVTTGAQRSAEAEPSGTEGGTGGSLLTPTDCLWEQTLLSGLQLHQFPTFTFDMDSLQARLPQQDQHVYTNSSVLEHQVPSAEHQPLLPPRLRPSMSHFAPPHRLGRDGGNGFTFVLQGPVRRSSVSSRDSVTYSNAVLTQHSQSKSVSAPLCPVHINKVSVHLRQEAC